MSEKIDPISTIKYTDNIWVKSDLNLDRVSVRAEQSGGGITGGGHFVQNKVTLNPDMMTIAKISQSKSNALEQGEILVTKCSQIYSNSSVTILDQEPYPDACDTLPEIWYHKNGSMKPDEQLDNSDNSDLLPREKYSNETSELPNSDNQSLSLFFIHV